jgi:hypothetical protein
LTKFFWWYTMLIDIKATTDRQHVFKLPGNTI